MKETKLSQFKVLSRYLPKESHNKDKMVSLHAKV
jgi:hypothetical protein